MRSKQASEGVKKKRGHGIAARNIKATRFVRTYSTYIQCLNVDAIENARVICG